MKNIFTFEWKAGSANDNIIKWLKSKNISFHYDHYFRLVADIYRNGKLYKFDYNHINGDLYGVTIAEAEA